MEMEKVPQAGYEIKGLWISGLVRKFTLKNLLFPVKLLASLMKANRIITDFKPDLVIGTGGFASGPTLRMASLRGVPCVLQEQNSFAGVTNKWLADKAARVFVAYEGMDRFFPRDVIRLTGNPVRAELCDAMPDKKQAKAALNQEAHRQTLLVLGGSLGARRINELIETKLSFLQGLGLQVLWQCGKGYYETYKKYTGPGVEVAPFIKDMGTVLAAADLIISRAGAGSVSELALVGAPVVFIPSPNVAEDHQRKNAEAIVAKGAAVMLLESELENSFEDTITGLVGNPDEMHAMGVRFRALAKPGATSAIVDEIEAVLNKSISDE
jgi:UDP-N-acetylglucosamine--N-acetylmuramyl-(pentapeptide) pyrophosphoryl-undecaprenol N-acetylglucosamine transferase